MVGLVGLVLHYLEPQPQSRNGLGEGGLPPDLVSFRLCHRKHDNDLEGASVLLVYTTSLRAAASFA
jgi:hypothetical protein